MSRAKWGIRMLDIIKRIFAMGPAVDYRSLLSEGGKVIDVRTPAEFASGHIKGSINIPLEKLLSGLGRIDKSGPLILCCASGRRSSLAKSLLSGKGFTRVYNGGSWSRLEKSLT